MFVKGYLINDIECISKGIEIPDPMTFITGIESVEYEDLFKMSVLRNAPMVDCRHPYVEFLCIFGSALFSRKEWNQKSTTQLFCNYCTATLEAFGVLVYMNNYDYWRRVMSNDGVETQDTSMYPLFTTDPSCKRRYEGWSNRGIFTFNKLVRLLKYQRSSRNSITVDEMVLCECIKRTKITHKNRHREAIAEVEVENIQFV